MKSITIHGIEDALDRKLQEKAKQLGLSQNRTIKSILEGVLLDEAERRESEYSDLFGSWTVSEKAEFDRRVQVFDQIDESDWKQ